MVGEGEARCLTSGVSSSLSPALHHLGCDLELFLLYTPVRGRALHLLQDILSIRIQSWRWDESAPEDFLCCVRVGQETEEREKGFRRERGIQAPGEPQQVLCHACFLHCQFGCTLNPYSIHCMVQSGYLVAALVLAE